MAIYSYGALYSYGASLALPPAGTLYAADRSFGEELMLFLEQNLYVEFKMFYK